MSIIFAVNTDFFLSVFVYWGGKMAEIHKYFTVTSVSNNNKTDNEFMFTENIIKKLIYFSYFINCRNSYCLRGAFCVNMSQLC